MLRRYWLAVSAGGTFSVLAVVCGVAIVTLIFYPLANLVGGLFFSDGSFGTTALEQTIAEPELVTVLRNTLLFVLLSGLFALVLGAILAWISERTDASLGWASGVLPLVPLFLPGIASAIGWVLLCAPRAGLVNVFLRAITGSTEPTGPIDIFSLPGMVFVTAIHLVPYSYLAVSSALRNLDSSLEEASRMSGAGVMSTLRRISLPMVTPALLTSAILIVMSCLTLFSIPAILASSAQFPVLSTLIYKLIHAVFPPRMGEAIVLCALALSLVQVLIWVQLTVASRRYQTIGSQGFRRLRVPLGGLRLPARALVLLYVLVAAVLPLLALIVVSFERYWTPELTSELLTFNNYTAMLGANAQVLTAIRNSVGLGIAVAVLDVGIATVLAYYLSRSPGFLSRILDVTAMFPATVPHIVMGVAFLLAFSQPPVVLYGTVTVIFLAYLAIYMPQAMQFAKINLGQISPELGEASRLFGASEGRTFVRILVPLILPGAVAGGIVVAVHTLYETNASVMLATVDSVVVGPTLLRYWVEGNIPPVAAFATVICAVGTLLSLGSMYIGRSLSVGGEAS